MGRGLGLGVLGGEDQVSWMLEGCGRDQEGLEANTGQDRLSLCPQGLVPLGFRFVENNSNY